MSSCPSVEAASGAPPSPRRAALVGRGFRDEPPGAAATSSGRRGGSGPARSLALRGSQALEGMRVLRTLGAGS